MKKKIFKNPGWKLGGLLLAFALWFHLTTEQQFSKEIIVDIDYTNIPSGFVLSPESQKSAILEISSSGKKLLRILYFEEIKLEVDISGYLVPGAYSVDFNREQLGISGSTVGVDIRFVAPLTCDFELIQLQ